MARADIQSTPPERPRRGKKPLTPGTGADEAANLPLSDTEMRARESFDTGVWAALDICRQSLLVAKKYNPFLAFEERIILLALRSTSGNQYRSAKLLGISRSTLRKRMKKHGIHIGVKVIDGK